MLFFTVSGYGQGMRERNEFRAIKIALGDRSYDVTIGADLLKRVTDYAPAVNGKVIFILTDENVRPYGEEIKKILEGQAAAVYLMAVPAGEQSKSFHCYEQVMAWMLDHTVTRQSLLFAVGGGVIGDLGGFAAATILRGIDFVQIPTSLLAMVDSAVGGKTAIDMPQGKNVVGAFHHTVSVIADTRVLETLPPREMRAGYAEAVKHGALGDAEFFTWLEHNGAGVLALEPAAVDFFIEKNCSIKAAIVAEDEREAGRRALLNLGHTFGHALETAAGYAGTLLHGEGVAVGLVLAAQLSLRLGHCDAATVQRLSAHLQSAGLPTSIENIATAGRFEPEKLVQSMYGDKKAETGGLTFVLLKKIGEAFVQRRVPENDVIAVLNQSIRGD